MTRNQSCDPLLGGSEAIHHHLTYHHVSLPRNPLPRNASIYQRVLSPSGFPRALRIRGSVIPRLLFPLIFFAAWAVFLAFVRHFYKSTRNWDVEVAAPLVLSLGLVVGMILGFRTNSAYQRFSEGREALGLVQVALRSLKIIFSRPDHFSAPQQCLQTLPLLPAFLISIASYLRRSLPANSLDPAAHRAARFATILERFDVTLNKQPLMLLEQLYDSASECKDGRGLAEVRELLSAFTSLERLTGTPIPSAYDIHLNQVITLYVLFFPLQITNYWLSIPATIFAAFTLFGVEAIGQEIENPFGFDWNDLPLDDYVEDFADEVQTAINFVEKNGNWARSSDTLLLEVQK